MSLENYQVPPLSEGPEIYECPQCGEPGLYSNDGPRLDFYLHGVVTFKSGTTYPHFHRVENPKKLNFYNYVKGELEFLHPKIGAKLKRQILAAYWEPWTARQYVRKFLIATKRKIKIESKREI